MWFDVLASMMTQQVPRFLQMHCRIFNNAFIGDPLTRGAGSEETTTSMLPVCYEYGTFYFSFSPTQAHTSIIQNS